MAGFIQIIEFRTSRWDELQALAQEFEDSRNQAAASGASPTKIHVVGDRDDPGRFLNIVEFESYEAAMENSNRPETGEFAARMQALCDGPPTFHNLDVKYEAQIG
jgi:quinol monooxygenase YgiN